MSRISTMRLSPGSAPRTKTGPVAGLTLEKSMSVTRSFSVWIWPEKQSWVSKVTTSPGSTSRTGFISGPKAKTASSFGMVWSTLSIDWVMPISFLSACRADFRVCCLVLDEYLLRLSDGLRTPRGSEPKGYETQDYPYDGKVVTEPHRVGRKGEELVVQRSEQDKDGQHREHAMQEHVELVPALAEVENYAAQAHSHIHQDNHDGDGRGYDAEAADGFEHSPEHEGDNQGEYRLRYGCHVRRAVFRVGASERPGQNIYASHGVHYTGRRVYARVRVGDSAIHDGEEDNDPSYSPVPRRHGGPGIRILDVGCHLVEAPTHHGCVGAHEVEEPDHQCRGENHPGYSSPGVASFFSKRGRRLEADEGEDGEDHPFEDPRPGAFKRVRGVEDLQGILAARCEDHVQPECQKRYYLEDPERDACVGGEPDAPVGQVENEYCSHEHPHPPRNVYAESVLEGIRSGRGEDEV